MNYSPEQIMQGLMSYADNEVIPKLPTSSKWIMGTAIALGQNKVHDIMSALMENSIVKMLGIVDNDGMIDADALISAMQQASDKYGSVTMDIPLVGKLTFSSGDVKNIKKYIV